MSKNKELIIICARDIFLDGGMSHFSMRKVAGCVGVSATALYRHYTNKEELLFQVMLQGFRIFARYLNSVKELRDEMACLQATTDAYLNFALKEHAYYEMMFMSGDQMTGLKKLSKEGSANMQQTFDLLQQRVQRAISARAINSNDSYKCAFGIWAYAHGLVSLYIAKRTPLSEKDFVATYKTLMSGYLDTL